MSNIPDRIIVTYGETVQVGPDDFQYKTVGRVFKTTRPIEDILHWLESMGVKNPRITDATFVEYTGASL
jgi:hypothetical protein